MNSRVIICHQLFHSFGDVSAVRDVSFETGRQEVFGLIGPDGSGKTTLFRILATLILADSGTASVLGRDVVREYREIRCSIGYMPGRFSLYHDLTVEENLKFYASVFGVVIRDNYHLIRNVYEPLEPFRNRPAGKLSGGMKQKLALACALVHRPELLILDEPTTGVDAVSRGEFWDHLGYLKDTGMTIVVSTPYMDEAQRCDRLALMQKGRILDSGTPGEIRNRFEGDLYHLECSDRYLALNLLRQIPDINSVHAFGQTLHLTFTGHHDLSKLTDILSNAGIRDIRFTPGKAGMEDCFMQKMSANL